MHRKFMLAVGWLGIILPNLGAATEYKSAQEEEKDEGEFEEKEDLEEDEDFDEDEDKAFYERNEIGARFPFLGFASLRIRGYQELLPLLIADLPVIRIGRLSFNINFTRIGLSNDTRYVRSSAVGPCFEWWPTWAENERVFGYVGLAIQQSRLYVVTPGEGKEYRGISISGSIGGLIEADEGFGLVGQLLTHGGIGKTEVGSQTLRRGFSSIGLALGMSWQIAEQ